MSNNNGNVGVLNRMGRNMARPQLDAFDLEAIREANAIRRRNAIAPRKVGQTRSGFGKACNHPNASPIGHTW